MDGFVDECAAGAKNEAEYYGTLTCLAMKTSLSTGEHSDMHPEKLALEKVWRTVRADVGREWRIKDLAGMAAVSVSSFKRLVARRYDKTPWEMVIGIRMETARQLLRRTDYPIKLIATRVGYADQFIFSTAFRKSVGVSPRQFRRDG